MKKVLIYSPYLKTLGGGEEHLLSIAQVLGQNNCRIDLICDDSKYLEKVKSKLHLEIQNVNLIENFLCKNIFVKIYKLLQYDIVIYQSDGSLFLPLAKKNFLLMLVPKRNIIPNKFTNKLKLYGWKIVTNSVFSKNILQKDLGDKIEVLAPYVSDKIFLSPKVKSPKKVILTVGRFFKGLHDKRQDIAISAFTALQRSRVGWQDYELHLVGGLLEQDKDYFESLQKLAVANSSIKFLPNISFEKLVQEYINAKYFWHFAGYEIDPSKSPEKTEHFGISVVEAMASSCATFAVGVGGPAENIEEDVSGVQFTSIDELIRKMKDVEADKLKYQKLIYNGNKVVSDSFTKKRFEERVGQIFGI